MTIKCVLNKQLLWLARTRVTKSHYSWFFYSLMELHNNTNWVFQLEKLITENKNHYIINALTFNSTKSNISCYLFHVTFDYDKKIISPVKCICTLSWPESVTRKLSGTVTSKICDTTSSLTSLIWSFSLITLLCPYRAFVITKPSLSSCFCLFLFETTSRSFCALLAASLASLT